MRFDLILVTYTPAHAKQAIRFCNSAFSRRRMGRRLLVINRRNVLDSLDAAEKVGWELVFGSNELGEFSGWQEGLDLLAGRNNGVIFLNDTVTIHRRFTAIRQLALKKAIRRAKGASFIGFRDAAPGDLAVGELHLSSWVRTYCFALTFEALALLGKKVYQPAIASACVPGGLDESTFFSGLSEDLTNRLRQNLFGGGWYASEPLSPSNSIRMAFKGRCIVSEKLLSARCEALGIEGTDPFILFSRWAPRLDDLILKGPKGIAKAAVRVVRRAVSKAVERR